MLNGFNHQYCQIVSVYARRIYRIYYEVGYSKNHDTSSEVNTYFYGGFILFVLFYATLRMAKSTLATSTFSKMAAKFLTRGIGISFQANTMPAIEQLPER